LAGSQATTRGSGFGFDQFSGQSNFQKDFESEEIFYRHLGVSGIETTGAGGVHRQKLGVTGHSLELDPGVDPLRGGYLGRIVTGVFPIPVSADLGPAGVAVAV